MKTESLSAATVKAGSGPINSQRPRAQADGRNEIVSAILGRRTLHSPFTIYWRYLLLLSAFVLVHPCFQGISYAASPIGNVLTGIDSLEAQNFAPLMGKRVGLITNQTGIDRSGHRTIDLLARAPGVKLVALFSPEHGIRGVLDERVSSTTDEATGVPIFSLYGDTVRPTDAMLAGVDTLVFDIQDVGVRFYTYITTMGYTMEAAASHHLAYYILDRPDPLGGERIEGPMLDPDRLSFVGYFAMPIRMAMTMGEIARMINSENKLGCDLHVIEMRNWRRRMYFDGTGLPWVNPSPNLRSMNEELLYPGIEILQAGGVSAGRGTDAPFEQFGAPWIRAEELASYLNKRSIPGVRFAPGRFTPNSGVHQGELCAGARVLVTDRAALLPVRMGMEIAAALMKFYPGEFNVARILALVGNLETVERLGKGEDPVAIESSWQTALEAFRGVRAKYLLYR
jgi:uncharacterized protein YbbC (DUF1343 family)